MFDEIGQTANSFLNALLRYRVHFFYKDLHTLDVKNAI
jgi:hypothetical protein